MENKKSFIILTAVLALLLVGAFVLYNSLADRQQPDQLATNPTQTKNTEPETVLSPAPDFTVYDIDGKALSLPDFRGKPVVLNFWASWCGPCKSEMPDFEKVYAKYGDRVHFLMINLTDGAQETVQSASEFISQSGYTFPVYYDTDIVAASNYSVWSIPATYFIDAQGYGVAWGSGALDLATIEKGIGMILPES